jgi:hypothetical protein
MSDDLGLSDADIAELVAILDTPEDQLSRVAGIGGRKRRKCKRTPLHPHCKSVKWSRVYEALRRKGKSKKNSAQIANHMYNKWRLGLVKRKAFP